MIKSCKKIILQFFLARFLQDFYTLQEKLHFSARLARYVQDLVQDFASLARKTLARYVYFLQGSFYWEGLTRSLGITLNNRMHTSHALKAA